MIRIPVPDIAYSTVLINMGGETFALTFRFNERMGRWKVDISKADGTVVRNGITLIEGALPTAHLNLDELSTGSIGVFQVEATDERASRNNLGIDKAFELVYIDSSEL